jgi:uncharacterized membrane protein
MSPLLLAAIDSTGYKIVLLLHILTVVIGFAPAWFIPMMGRLAAKGDAEAGAQLEASILRFSLPGIVLAGLFGFALAGMSEKLYSMSQAWLSIAAVLWVVLLLVTVFVARPAVKALSAGDLAARGRVMAATGITHLTLIVMLYLMIFKPGLSV